MEIQSEVVIWNNAFIGRYSVFFCPVFAYNECQSPAHMGFLEPQITQKQHWAQLTKNFTTNDVRAGRSRCVRKSTFHMNYWCRCSYVSVHSNTYIFNPLMHDIHLLIINLEVLCKTHNILKLLIEKYSHLSPKY